MCLPRRIARLVFTRIIDATTKAVFEAWINPQHLAKWWGPKGFTNPVCELDARPGGAILIHMCGPDGQVIPMKGTFHEIVQNQRIVMSTSAFEDEGGNPQIVGLNTITFEEHEGKTKLTVQDVVTKATPEMAAALDGMDEGWKQSVDRLEAHVTTAAEHKTHHRGRTGERTITDFAHFDARAAWFRAWTSRNSEALVGLQCFTVDRVRNRPAVGGAIAMSCKARWSQHPFQGCYRGVWHRSAWCTPRFTMWSRIQTLKPLSQCSSRSATARRP
jgi:uncharacterized protein YndB with AHSA1/START domain